MNNTDRPEPESRSQSTMGCKRVGISTLGCKVNTFESQLIAQKLREADWKVVDGKDIADLYIINTCTVTLEADRQARQAIRRAVRRNPNARVVVTGCYAQMSPNQCASIPGVDLVVGNDRKLSMDQLLPGLLSGSLEKVMVGNLDEHISLPDRLLTHCEGKTRAYVQVQQGCNQGCTFCIIHRARGPSRSLLPTTIVRQVRRLVEEGYKEVVICGVDLGSYGEDFGAARGISCDLVGLLEELCGLDQDFRIRLSSIDPAHINQRLTTLLADRPMMCPHLHLSLQSGNSLILKRMKRRYGADEVREKVAMLREAVPGLVLSADIMTGFPTETREQFIDSLRMVRELGVAYPHVFPYSDREGTPASRIPDRKQVPAAVRKSRARALRRVGDGVRRRLLESRLGSTKRILVEGGHCPLEGYQRGRAADYTEVWVPVTDERVGEWADVIMDSIEGDALIARLIG